MCSPQFPGIEKRIYNELTRLLPERTGVRVRALPNRELLSWVGAARWDSLVLGNASCLAVQLQSVQEVLIARWAEAAK
jgi:actin-related protein